MMKSIYPILLLICSNCFMTMAWYGHLKNLREKPLMIVVLLSWGIAFFEYVLQVPANRLGVNVYSVPELKIIQEVISMIVFAVFAAFYLKTPITRNFFYASLCLVGAVFFIFRDASSS